MTHDELIQVSNQILDFLTSKLPQLPQAERLKEIKDSFANLSKTSKFDKQMKQDLYAKLAYDLHPAKLCITNHSLYSLIVEVPDLFKDMQQALDAYQVSYPVTLPNLLYATPATISEAAPFSKKPLLEVAYVIPTVISYTSEGIFLEGLNGLCDKVLTQVIEGYKLHYDTLALKNVPLSRLYEKKLSMLEEAHKKNQTAKELDAIEKLQTGGFMCRSHLTAFDRLQLIAGAAGSLFTKPLPAGVVNAGCEIITRLGKGAVVCVSGVVFAITELARPVNALLTLAEFFVFMLASPVTVPLFFLVVACLANLFHGCCKMDSDTSEAKAVGIAPSPLATLGGTRLQSQHPLPPTAPSQHAGPLQGQEDTRVHANAVEMLASAAP